MNTTPAATTRPYNDIILLTYNGIKRHPAMSACDRAAQFAPFAAIN